MYKNISRKKYNIIKKYMYFSPNVRGVKHHSHMLQFLILFLSWAKTLPINQHVLWVVEIESSPWICIIIIIINDHDIIRNECSIFRGLEDLNVNVKLCGYALQARWTWFHVCGIWDLLFQPKEEGSAVR